MLACAALREISRYQSDMMALRRDLHASPELGFEELRTSALVADYLLSLGLEVHRGIGKTGVVAILSGQRTDSGKSVGLRADMDALPIQELSTFEHISKKPGIMHACGHDGHTVMLLAAASYLSLQRNFNGTVVFVFQPAEEGLGGAQAMIDDGLLERFPVDAMYALHNWPKLPAGMIGLNEGPMMAAADRFEITVQGQGGHGAHPHQTTDPVLVAAHIVTALQSIVSRNVSPIDAAVLSVTSLLAGDLSAISVIPERATIAGTVRTFRASVQRMMEHRISQVAQGAAQAFGANATLRYEKMMPATTNTPVCARLVARAASKVVGQSQVVTDLDPSMGSEDFSFMLQKVPGAYFRLGQGTPDSSTALHSPHYDFNDAVIPIGAAVFAEIVGLALPLNQ